MAITSPPYAQLHSLTPRLGYTGGPQTLHRVGPHHRQGGISELQGVHSGTTVVQLQQAGLQHRLHERLGMYWGQLGCYCGFAALSALAG